MNSQLLAHMETFDSDEEYSDDPELYENSTNPLDPIDAARYNTKVKVRKFVKPKNVTDVLLKLLYVIPVAIALGDHLGFFWSMTFSIMTLVLLQLRPPPVVTKTRSRRSSQQRRTSRRRSSMSTISSYGRRRSSSGSIGWERSESFASSSTGPLIGGKNVPKSAASVLDMVEMIKQQVHDCRKETSRLLGLIGAPPLEWKLMDSSSRLMVTRTISSNSQHDKSLAGDVTIASAQIINDLALKSLIKFLEAHAQFLLTVDHAYYWMRVSASLHWGLGPHSQCVERVERAAIAKEFRNNRRQSISGSRITEGIRSPLEPHRKLDTSSILAMSSSRRNLAQSLIDQSKSLVHTFKQIRGLNDDAQNQDLSQFELQQLNAIMDDKVLVMPDVVDLNWIKASRKHLAILLSYTADYYCTMDGLQVLSVDAPKRSLLDESMLNARNAREYLLCNLLLGKTPTARPAVEENGASTDELMMSLLQYREQLEGLGAALWACQQYSKLRTTDSDPTLVLSAAEILQREEEAEASKLAWWNQIKDLSSTCKDLEREIEGKFFPAMDNNNDTQDNESTPVANGSRRALESGEYEHGKKIEQNQKANGGPTSTKTLVFSGKGAVEKKPVSVNTKAESWRESSSSDAPIPARDTVAEQLLVRELQNRISSLVQDKEEQNNEELSKGNEQDEEGEVDCSTASDDIKIEVDSMDRDLDNILDTYESFDESDNVDEWQSEEKDTNGDLSNESDEKEEADELVSIKPVYVGDVKEREAATSLFLGASGSLLAELKQNLSQGDVGMSDEETAEILSED